MKTKTLFIFVMLAFALVILFLPFVSFGQSEVGFGNETITIQEQTKAAELDLYALLQSMVLQVVKSPASLLVIIGLTILSTMAEVIKICPSNPVRIILPFCIIGGAASYWLFSPTSSVDKHFPHPHAVFVINGMVCGIVAFVIHVKAVLWLVNHMRQAKAEK